MEFFSNIVHIFNEKSLRAELVHIVGFVLLAKGLSIALPKLLKLYLDRAYPTVSKEVNVAKAYTPWLFIFFLGLFLPRPIQKIFEDSTLDFAMMALRITFFSSGVMLVTRSMHLLKVMFNKFFDYSGVNNLRKRALTTQFQFVEKVLVITLWCVTFISILCSFKEGRDFAKSLIASAGILGIVIGFAAKQSLSNLMAGFQIAFTQPIRLDDVVIVESQWGRVEKITLTYVVICLWDLRRLVVPINYFIEKPFENWTKTSADLLPYIYIYTDYSVPIHVIRKEYEKILKQTKLWDGKVSVMQVTDIREHSIEIRALMSASNAPEAFDLRCFVREKLIEFIQSNYPTAFPKTRFTFTPEASTVPQTQSPYLGPLPANQPLKSVGVT